MTTFFALLFGILFGIIAGVIFTSAMMLSSENLRNFMENEAMEIHQLEENEEL